MATGKPIIASGIGSIIEILNNSNAIIFDPDDINSLYRSLDFCLKNPTKIKTLGYNAKKHLKQNYTWEIRVESIKRFISESI